MYTCDGPHRRGEGGGGHGQRASLQVSPDLDRSNIGTVTAAGSGHIEQFVVPLTNVQQRCAVFAWCVAIFGPPLSSTGAVDDAMMHSASASQVQIEVTAGKKNWLKRREKLLVGVCPSLARRAHVTTTPL